MGILFKETKLGSDYSRQENKRDQRINVMNSTALIVIHLVKLLQLIV